MSIDLGFKLIIDNHKGKFISYAFNRIVVKYFHNFKKYIPCIYVIFLLMPIYFLICWSFKTEIEIKKSITPIPMLGTLANYKAIFTDPQSYMAFVNSLLYVFINNVLSLVVAVPAAYAFSRYSFLATNIYFSGFLPAD